MTKALYTAKAKVTGGRAAGHGKTSDGQLEVDLRLPKELGGEGDGTNPEELFAVGYAACFEGALGTVGRRAKQEVGDVSIDSSVSLVTTDDRAFTVAVELDVTLPSLGDDANVVFCDGGHCRPLLLARWGWHARPGGWTGQGAGLVSSGAS